MKTLSIRILMPLALGATALSLAACSKDEPESFNSGTGDPQAAELANASTLPPPPMIKSSHSYRCKDNSLIYVDFMTDDKTANFKDAKDAPVTVLTAPEAGKPFVSADGKTTVTGGGNEITHNGLACKAG